MNINALNLVDNRRTRAADGPLIKTYISHTERIRKSPPNSASDEWNMIPPSVRLPDTKLSFKTKLRKLVKKFFVEKWRHDIQFTNDALVNNYNYE